MYAQTPGGNVDGWKLTVRTTVDSGSLDHKHWNTNTMYIAEHFVRTEVTEAHLTRMPPGIEVPITITDDSAHTMTMLMGRFRSATVRKLASAPTLSKDSTSRFIVAPTMTMRDLGPGEPILGHPTHKYSVTTSFVAQKTLFGSPCKLTARNVETIWAATDLQREEKLRKYVRDSRPIAGTELGPVDDSLQRLQLHRERFVNGLILRSEVAHTKPAAGGTKTAVTLTMEVLELSKGPIPRSMFAVPADYSTIAMPARPARTAADSAAFMARRAKIESTLKAGMHASICDP